MNTFKMNDGSTITGSRADLLIELQNAAKQKGSTPIARDADSRRYGLQTKSNYVNAFGSWNRALESAGLPINRNRGIVGQPRAAQSSAPSTPREERRPFSQNSRFAFGSVEEWLEATLRDERERVSALEKLYEVYHS